MFLRKFALRLALIGFGFSSLTTQAQELLSTNDAPALQAELRHGETVGLEIIRRAYTTIGTNRFVFRVPEELELDATRSDRLVLSNPKTGCFIEVRPISATAGDGIESYRQMVQHQFSTAQIVDEFSDSVLSRLCPAFVLKWTVRAAEQKARVTFIPVAGRWLEFTLVAPTEKFSDSSTLLKVVLASLQSDEHGPIEIQPLPNHS